MTEDERFVEPPGERAALRFERRRLDRWPIHGVAVAHQLAGEGFGRRSTLRLRDESVEGLGAWSDRPLEPGTLLSVGFASPGEPIRTGVVLRCLPCGDGYRIAIRFETRMAA